MAYLGIDVSKSEFHAVLLSENDRTLKHSFPNNRHGHVQLLKWLTNRGVKGVHTCMEATGGFGEELAIVLHDGGHQVSIVNPSRIKAFGQSEGLRTKTDAVDAALIARFCRSQRPDPWIPPTPNERTLQAFLRRRESLIDMRTMELNRAQAPGSAPVEGGIQEHIQYLDHRIAETESDIRKLIDEDPTLRSKRQLLQSIPGIGEKSANEILGEAPRLDQMRDVKAVGAHSGLSPRHNQSGQSPGRSRLSKAGKARLRKALYFPALSAMRHNPVIKAFAARLRARGKAEMVIIAAAMRKLLTIAYGVLKSGRPFTVQPS